MKKAKPILFSTPMVRALLEGRKTQTRRIIKPKIPEGFDEQVKWEQENNFPCGILPKICPFGTTGDFLWVRESFTKAQDILCYSADSPKLSMKHELLRPWIPSIHMPKWASRLTLEITDIRVEKLQDISEKDALKEGFIKLPATGRVVLSPGAQYFGNYWHTAKAAYKDLWNSINGKGSWDANPFVWVIEFKVHKCNVMKLLT